MNSNQWVYDVLVDLERYAISNQLSVTAKLLKNAIPVIEDEIVDQCNRRVFANSSAEVFSFERFRKEST